MPSRAYKCPLCHSAFRNESGMKWHLAHRHEVPTAFDALGKEYETKLVSLQDENTLLKQKVQQLLGVEGELGAVRLKLSKTAGLQDENNSLKQKLQQVEGELSTFKLKFSEAIEAMTKYSAEILRCQNVYNKEIITMVHEGLEDAAKELFGTKK